MGMYDTVEFICPACSTPIYKQSKAGKCELACYPQDRVPVAIATQFFGDVIHCSNCGKHYEIDAGIPPMQCISTTLKEVG